MQDMEQAKEEREIFTTSMFDNLLSMEEQSIEFEVDKWDFDKEFSILRPVASRGCLLWPSMTGLIVIKDKVHTLKQYAVQNSEDPDKEPDDELFKAPKRLECKVEVAKPRTQEAWNFIGNVREILHLRYVEKVKPKEIGWKFCIWPEKINALVKQYVIGAEERYWEWEANALKKTSMLEFRIELVREALKHLKGKVITTHLIMDTI